MRIWGLACVIGLVGTMAAASTPVLYDCDITKRRKDVGWISPKIAIVVGPEGQVSVSDGVILHFKKAPIPGKMRKRAAKVIVDWSLSGVVDGAEQIVPKFNYRATINTNTNAIYLQARPVGFPQSWSGRGTCKTRTK